MITRATGLNPADFELRRVDSDEAAPGIYALEFPSERSVILHLNETAQNRAVRGVAGRTQAFVLVQRARSHACADGCSYA